MNNWHVTYEIITPESAEDGEAEERGYFLYGGWHFNLADMPQHWDDPVKADEAVAACAMDLRTALQCVNGLEDCGRWFAECDGREDYADCGEERRSLHPPRNITPASYERVKRLLKSMRHL
jgi:hypothetical protein